MLIRFEVANFRSILEPVELSMVAVDRERPAVRAIANLGESLLPVAALYGPNASGKSNVLAALTWLRLAVRDSLRTWDDRIPTEPFAFATGTERNSEFTVELVVDDIRFEYVVEVDRREVRYEGLFHYPERKRRRIFERDDEFKLQRGLGNLSGTRDLLTPRTLALSVARRFDEPLVSRFARALLSAQTIGIKPATDRWLRGVPTHSSLRWFEGLADEGLGDLLGQESAAEADRQQALALLRMADLGIDDIRVEREDVLQLGVDSETGRARGQRLRVSLLHRTAAGLVPLDINAESDGTRTWFALIGPVLDALRSGALLLFDELDASLHPTLAAELIRLFADPATNTAGAQLIFTSHDTSLLNHLNRDEVWLTEKRPDGSTRLGALAEFAGERVRQSQNLERGYLQGRFGALPEVNRTALLRALGLIG